jgi:hypothetical protein
MDMSHKLTRYVLTYEITVDAHDDDEAMDQASQYLDAFYPDSIVEEGDGDACLEDDCVWDEEDDEDDDI